ncbi:putative serine/threonine-protein kinase pats1 [Stylophora pistillata]|uniref:Putative serine/threonine-protein kinase pats1 n=1 Tax=Stylophora pistillata TaxID=50429 RepID=A0A2B4RQM2_STYPI|nr:putative serine/threonine-protein kinase pats1 [Stylophora pistillata]
MICSSRTGPTDYAYVPSREAYKEGNVSLLDDEPKQKGQNEGENYHNECEQQPVMEIDPERARGAVGAEKVVAKIVTGTVPREILKRGPLAFEACDKAHRKGTPVVRRVPIIFIGQHRSGKTSVKNSLKGQPFNVNEDSNRGKDAHSSIFKVSREIWKVGEKGQDPNHDSAFSFDHHPARSTAQHLRYKTPIESELCRTISSESSNSKHTSNSPESKFTGADVIHLESRDPAEMFKDLQFRKKPESSQNSTSTGRNINDDSNSGEALPQTEITDEDIYSMLWDFCGESVNYTAYPIFLTPKAVYILVYDLRKNARASAKPVVKQGRYRELEDSHLSKTNLDYLKFWMSSVASSANQQEDNPSKSTSEVLPEKLPPVFLVFTHADTLGDGGDSKKIARDIYGSLKQTPSGVHLYKDFFVVDIAKSGREFECSEILRLRKEVLAACSELPQLRETIPIQSLMFEKAIQKKKEEGHKFVSLEDARLLADEECNISDEKQFQKILNFLHDQRILIHFHETPELKRLVILDSEWLINVFTEVMSVKLYEGSESKLEHLWRKLETEGILEENLLEYIWGPLHDKKNTYESLLAIMERFGLILPLPSLAPSNGKTCLVPSMLMSYPTQGITSLVAAARIPPIFLTFESGRVPSGLFLRIALQLVQWNRENNPNSANYNLYNNYVRFYPSMKENCSVILQCHSSSIEVVVHGHNANHELEDGSHTELDLPRQEPYDANCARAVRKQLEVILTSMHPKFFWPKNTRYRVGFMCPICCQNGGIVKECKFHLQQGCKQEECLHFLSESEICSANIINCTRNPVAPEIRVRKEQFEPWLMTTPQQGTREESIKTQVSLQQEVPQGLPREIQDFLRLPSHDNRGINFQDLHEFQEILKTDSAFPKRSDPETKKRIHLLARKSVAKNRFDVLKHLRKITPAGSTGPSVPENTDIRNISHRRRKKLTESLSGGQDWKLLAEKLGLHPDEIRYLDYRVRNPCEGVLIRAAAQDSVNVGDLYNLLVELGYPLIADEL